MERVIAYIDGFNLYFGLKTKNWRRYLWLNLQLLASNLLKPHQRLLYTKYFTARVTNFPSKEKRQNVFLEALGTLDDFRIFYGKFQLNERICRSCQVKDTIPIEKMSDVNIAVELLTDAFLNSYDVALLVSADGDLAPAVRAVRQLFPEKRIVAAFPPARNSEELRSCVHNAFTIGRLKIARSLFPKQVIRKDGYILKCPSKWR